MEVLGSGSCVGPAGQDVLSGVCVAGDGEDGVCRVAGDREAACHRRSRRLRRSRRDEACSGSRVEAVVAAVAMTMTGARCIPKEEEELLLTADGDEPTLL